LRKSLKKVINILSFRFFTDGYLPKGDGLGGKGGMDGIAA